MATFNNITIDDTLNATSLVFNPPDCDGQGWKTMNGRGAGGSYSTCTDSAETPSVTLNFTGVAIYYRSPYFDGYAVRFRLDGVLSDDVDLSTPQGTRFNASATRIVYSQTGLENKVHTLVLLPSHNSTLNVDAFIVTAQNGTSFPPPTNATVPTPPNPFAPLLSTQGLIPEKTTKLFGLAVGISVGSISFIVLIVLFILAARTRRRLQSRFKWSGRAPPLSNDRQLSYQSRAAQQEAIRSRDSTPSPPPSPRKLTNDVPMRSMISLPVGSDASHDVRPWSPPASNASHKHLMASPSSRTNSLPKYSSPAPTSVKFEPVRRAT